MVFKTDEDMSLDKYWEKHCISIAKDRRWAIQKGDQYSFENCATTSKRLQAIWICQSPKLLRQIFCTPSPRSPRHANTKKPPSRRSSRHCGTSFPTPLHADMLTTSFQKIVREKSQIILRL